jgi:RimJ/RimL family protein N-acetyltransferase
LLLRQLRLADAPSLHIALSDKSHMQWWSSAEHKSVAETEAYISRNASEGEKHLCWAITERDEQALGFRREGRLREEWKTHIGVRDSLIYAVLANDWLASPATPGVYAVSP